MFELTGMANTRVVDLNPHFMSLWRRNLDVLYHEVLSGFPGNGGLWCNGLATTSKLPFSTSSFFKFNAMQGLYASPAFCGSARQAPRISMKAFGRRAETWTAEGRWEKDG